MGKLFVIEITVSEEHLRAEYKDNKTSINDIIKEELLWALPPTMKVESVVSAKELIEEDGGVMYYSGYELEEE